MKNILIHTDSFVFVRARWTVVTTAFGAEGGGSSLEDRESFDVNFFMWLLQFCQEIMKRMREL